MNPKLQRFSLSIQGRVPRNHADLSRISGWNNSGLIGSMARAGMSNWLETLEPPNQTSSLYKPARRSARIFSHFCVEVPLILALRLILNRFSKAFSNARAFLLRDSL